MSENQGQGRANLKEYFETDKMPTEDHFANLIDSSLNKTDDQLTVADSGSGENSGRFLGVGSTDPQSPLSIRNRTGDAKLIGLEDTDGNEAWNISVNTPGGNNGLLLASNNNPNAALMVGVDGNVGIGTQAPTEKLEVNGNVSVTNGDMNLATGNLNLNTGSADVGGYLIVNGNTGIGTDAPGEKLDVNGNVRVTNGNINLSDGDLNLTTGDLNIISGSANITGDLAVDGNTIFTNSNLDLANGDLNLASGNLSLSAGTADIFGGLVVNGNTGIGTDTPVEKLDVNGNVRVENGSIELVNGGLNLTMGGATIAGGLSVDGNTGMGTVPDPGFRLDVSGNIRATGNLTAQSFEGDISWNNITGIPNALQNFDGTLNWGNITAKPNSLIPAGVIVMWSGNAADVPDTWTICDGANGTPDLRDRFIVGAGSTYNPGDTGGQNEVTLTVDQMPVHNHSHDLSIQPGGDHSHTLNNETGDGVAGGNNFNMTDGTGQGTLDTNNAGEHIHTLSGGIGNTGGDQPHENRPPYYALVYIIKL